MIINLDAPMPGCPNFYWREVLELKQWAIHTFPKDNKVKYNLVKITEKLQIIRGILGDRPIKITSAYRPTQYNEKIRGATNSYHKKGMALDFCHPKYNADRVREILLPRLESLGIRMENKPLSSWVHIDIGEVVNERFFKP